METNFVKTFFLLLFTTFLVNIVNGQSKIKIAEKSLLDGDFGKAISLFNDVKNIDQNSKALASRGIAYFNVNELSLAAKDITASFELGNRDAKLKYFMGKINHHMRNYEDAIYFYKEYLRDQKSEDGLDPEVALNIKHCFSALKKKYKASEFALIENVGNEINDKYDQINPVFSPNHESKFYYSNNANANFDLAAAEMSKGVWTTTDGIQVGLNTTEDEVLQDCTLDGSIMLFLRGSHAESNNTVCLNRYAENRNSQRILFSEVKAVSKDKDIYLVNDELMIFSSNRDGGYGGYDLYFSEFTELGWSKPKNLGPEINSPYDEVFPFYNETKTDLFFSSNRAESIGGFDIFHAEYENGKLKSLDNPNYPLNSSGDDINFRIQKDGHQALFSSDRKTGNGGFDIYSAFLKDKFVVHISEIKQPFGLIRSSVKYDDFDDGSQELEEPQDNEEPQEVAIIEKEDEIKLNNKKFQEQIESDLIEAETTQVELELQQSEQDPIAEITIQESTVDQDANEHITVADKEKLQEESIESELAIEENVSIEIETQKETTNSKRLKNIKLGPIFYNNSNELLNEKNMQILDKLAQTLKDNRQSKVILTCHSLKEGLPEFELMYTIKLVEKVAEYIENQGVDPSKIFMNSVGSSYPAVRKISQNELYEKEKYKNSFVDIKISNPSENVEIETPKVNPKIEDTSYKLYKTLSNDVYFRVLIHTTNKKMFKNAVLRYYNDIYIERDNKEANYKYYVGLYPDFKRTFSLLKTMKGKYIEDAKMIAFYNGMKLTYKEAQLLQDEYPELKNYLDLLDKDNEANN